MLHPVTRFSSCVFQWKKLRPRRRSPRLLQWKPLPRPLPRLRHLPRPLWKLHRRRRRQQVLIVAPEPGGCLPLFDFVRLYKFGLGKTSCRLVIGNHVCTYTADIQGMSVAFFAGRSAYIHTYGARRRRMRGVMPQHSRVSKGARMVEPVAALPRSKRDAT